MSDKPVTTMQLPEGYPEWLITLKNKIHHAQQQASRVVNQEMIALYWHIGKEIRDRQTAQAWGAKVVERLAHDLRKAFPGMKGFSRSNLLYMRAFAEAWPDPQIVQQVVGQLPWGHNLILLSKLKNSHERLAYAQKTLTHGWSRNVLVMQIESRLLEREGQATTNFDAQLPRPQSDLARESLKDPYRFDFLGLSAEAQERDIERALAQHVSEFLLELGAGFAFVGRQVPLEVGGEGFFMDLLFYHLKLRCYLVIELKAGDFKPEHLGKLSFYLTAVDRQIKTKEDQPTIGLLLCKSKNKVVAEYALGDKNQPMGIAEYQLADALPKTLEANLPSIEQIERELHGQHYKTG